MEVVLLVCWVRPIAIEVVLRTRMVSHAAARAMVMSSPPIRITTTTMLGRFFALNN
jgi:hypothetical protein